MNFFPDTHGVEPKQKWNYVEVRPGANMFWWLYYTVAPGGYTKRPLVVWLQVM